MKYKLNGKQFTIEELRDGYRTITGLDNDNDFTDEELYQYMLNAYAMEIRIVNRNTGDVQKVMAETVDFDAVYWTITTKDGTLKFKRKDFIVKEVEQ